MNSSEIITNMTENVGTFGQDPNKKTEEIENYLILN